MSGGFWAGAVPPWAYVAGFSVCLLFLCVGELDGWRRCAREAREELEWKREQAKARRTHPVYRQPPELTHEPLWQYQAANPANAGQVVHMPVLEPTEVISPGDMTFTGEFRLRLAEFERDMADLIGGTDERLREVTR